MPTTFSLNTAQGHSTMESYHKAVEAIMNKKKPNQFVIHNEVGFFAAQAERKPRKHEEAEIQNNMLYLKKRMVMNKRLRIKLAIKKLLENN